MKLIAILGEPASGKTTLMRALMKDLAMFWTRVKSGVVVWEEGGGVAVLGAYDDGELFAGTDRLSMAAQPAVLKWLPKCGHKVVLFEGDRLGNVSFLTDARKAGAEVSVVTLKCGAEELHKRHRSRGDTQGEEWLRGRQSKVRNVLEAFPPALEVVHATPQDTAKAVKKIAKLVRG